jgi:hypothetical protein
MELGNLPEEELLDSPIRERQRFPKWAAMGAAGILGLVLSIAIRVKFLGLFNSTINLSDVILVPDWVYLMARGSAVMLFFGITLTLLRKEPKSTFRIIIISLGSLLLIFVLLTIGFAFYMDNFYVRET